MSLQENSDELLRLAVAAVRWPHCAHEAASHKAAAHAEKAEA